jgi:hypothetical protein
VGKQVVVHIQTPREVGAMLTFTPRRTTGAERTLMHCTRASAFATSSCASGDVYRERILCLSSV